MANELQAVRTEVKVKLDIPSASTDFDSMLLLCIEQAIYRLTPWVQYQIPEDVTVSLPANDSTFELPVTNSRLDALFYQPASTDHFKKISSWRQYREVVYLYDTYPSAVTLKILASRPFANSDADAALLEADYPFAMLPLYYFTMSEFAASIVGNKRKFNIYQQMNGVRTLSEMQELVDFYDARAVRLLEDAVSAEGR